VSGTTRRLVARRSSFYRARSDETVARIINEHPALFRPVPIIGAACGLRQGEIFGLAAEDIDYDAQVIHVRRQVKKLGAAHVFAMPKNDRERDVPLPEWAGQTLQVFTAAQRQAPYSLPWEKPDGRPTNVNLLFRWTDDLHVRARGYDELIWKPALAAVGVIPAPTTDKRGRRRRHNTDRKTGMHALRHYYASVCLADGVSIRDLAEFLGHSDPAFTPRIYAHPMPSSHERARRAIDARMFRPRARLGRNKHGTEPLMRQPTALPLSSNRTAWALPNRASDAKIHPEWVGLRVGVFQEALSRVTR
jgi:integrase